MATTVSFALNQCSVTISTFTLTGYAAGDAVSIEFPSDDFEMEVGSDGFVTYVQKHNTTADVVIRLAQGNPLVDQLRALHETSRQAGGVTWPFNARNLKSTESASGKLMFKKHPPIKWADSVQPIEFTASLSEVKISGGLITPT